MGFKINIKNEKNGPMIGIMQDTSYQEEILTIYEAEQLRNQLTKIITDARNILNAKIKFKM